MSDQLPEPRLTLVYRLEATLGEPLDLGESAQGHRRIVPQTGGTFRGPEIAGKLIPGASADWQIVLPDGTALADIRYTLQTDDGALLYVRSRGVRHGSPEVLARLARGEDVDAGEYTFRTTSQIETATPELDWLNKGVFIGVGVSIVTSSKSGIPLLVDLPIIGRLFGVTRTSEQKRDLLILVTPHIIDDGDRILSARPSASNR